MKLQVTQENLSRALNNVARIATTRNTLPILANVLIKTVDNRVCIAATDLNIAITNYIGSKVSESGSITVPARLAQDFISSLPGGVIDIRLEDSKLHIKTDQHKSIINGMPAGDYPVMPKIKEGKSWKVPSKELKNALSQVVVAASNDDARPVLTGVNFYTTDGSLYLVATDSYRLAEKKLMPMKQEVNILVPASAVQDLLRLLDDREEEVKVTSDEQQILFQKGDVELVTRLIDGKFPDYRKLIPEKFNISATVSKEELANIVKVSSLFARETAGSVKINIDSKAKQIGINSIASQLGENSAGAAAKTSGDGEITLNSRYIMDAVNALAGDEVFIGFNEKLEPFIVKDNKDDGYKHVIMPLKS
ncbi:MAG TPA: DNA polymerase III subunit beta [Candidatus Saccharimonadales bacterium]|nr:DNA polymerase III subunit beta [Candidatus Saccharimonadales bacterium]